MGISECLRVAQPITVVADTTGERAALDSFHLVGMGLARHCDCGPDR